MIDPENPVVKLCAEGMQAELAGRPDEARAIFLRAWELRRDDFEACIAAHYIARHQESAEDGLRWNQTALECALRVGEAQVGEFYPSLYLNLGWSYESTGEPARAADCYRRAAAALEALPAGGYRDVVAGGIEKGLERTKGIGEDKLP